MITTPDFEEVSRHWGLVSRDHPDYDIVRNNSVFRAGFSSSSIFESQYRELLDTKADLEEQYRGYDVEEVFKGESVDNPDGSCFLIKTPVNEAILWPDPAVVRETLMKDLTLVRGIGPVKAELLRKRGCRTIEDLIHNKTFRNDAEACARIIRQGNPEQVMRLIVQWHPRSHPLNLLAGSLFGRDKFLFIDLETLGFFSRPIILFGLAAFYKGDLVVQQYLVREMEEELAALSETIRHMRAKPVVVSYNGKSFDIPYLVSRAAFYGTSPVSAGLHIDLLHISRRLFGRTTRDCRLGTIERHVLNIGRRIDIPGSLVPEFYETYQRTGNPGPLIPVVEHNREDIITLARLFSHLSGDRRHGS